MLGYEQRDISRFINSSNADWKPPYAVIRTYGGVRGGRKSPYSIILLYTSEQSGKGQFAELNGEPKVSGI